MIKSRRLTVATAFVLLGGCAMLGESGRPLPPAGLAVGDEPYSVQTGAAVLAHGGNAADAVAAMYFKLSVTYPVAAGLGGGGLCIVHDSTTSKSDAVVFPATEAAGGGTYAVPGNVRGFSLLQATYGRLPWQRVIAPAESAAAAGFVISQALAARLATSQDIVRLDAGLAAEFLDESGRVKPAGALVTAPALAQTLSLVRTLGAEAFYRGAVAADIVSYSAAQGGAITAADLSSYAPQRSAPATAQVGSQTVYLPPAETGAGRFAGALLARLRDGQGRAGTAGNLAASVAMATKATLDSSGLASLPRDLGSTGFAAEDPEGMAVACAVTMNGPFGSGHTATNTGVTLARSPGQAQAGLAAMFLTPAIATDDGAVSLVGAGAGGPNGTAGIALELLRLAHGDDVTRPENLHSAGVAPYDTINVIGCQSGVCAALPDPGAFGLGAAGGL